MQKEQKNIKLNDHFNEKDTEKYIKSYMFIKGFAVAKNLNQTLISLSLARRLHEGQYRKDGLPYFVHPLKVCSTLINYGIDDDTILSAALLHDILEDCSDKLPLKGQELITEYHLSPDILDIILLLTKKSGLNDYELSIYFQKIEKNSRAALIKLSDRLHNSTNLYTFSFERMRKYIKETDDFIIPLASYCTNYYPQYTNEFAIFKANITSLNTSMRIMLDKLESHQDVKGNSTPNTP
ncbi:HD domain-containing protein [Dorea sp.]